jgi:hypothetical protein
VETAVAEVKAQLDLGRQGQRYSVGIIHCYYEFLESGVVEALQNALPFDLVGITSISVQTERGIGRMALSLTVFTSDDVIFVTNASREVTDDPEGPVTEMYQEQRKTIEALGGKRPSLLFTFIPFLPTLGADVFIELLNRYSNGIPGFGGLPVSDESSHQNAQVIFRGRGFHASMVSVAVVGNVKPSFYSACISKQSITRQKGLVTEVKRNVLLSVNNIPALDYFQSFGFAKDGTILGIDAIVLIFSMADGTKLQRSALRLTPERGIEMASEIPKGTRLSLAILSADEVLSTTESLMRTITEERGERSVLMYSCAGRFWSLGLHGTEEHEKVREILGNGFPYAFSYCGGEIYPTLSRDCGGGESQDQQGWRMQLQNDTLIVCLL